MRRLWVLQLFLCLLGTTAGCQSLSHESLTALPSSGEHGPGSHAQGELSSKATAEACRVTAEAMEKDGKEIEAIGLYEKARQNGASSPQISRRLAVLYDSQKNYVRALEEYKLLLQRSPKDADLLNDVGYCHYNQGNWAEAEKYLRQALAVNAAHARAWINLGMTLAQAHHTQESLEAFSKVVTPGQARCNLAFILTTQGKGDDAKAAYREALAMEPELVLARRALDKLEKTAVPNPPTQPMPDAARPDAAASRDLSLEQMPVEVPLP